MSDTAKTSAAKIHVAITSARELELEVDDADKVGADVESAVADGNGVLWITDTRGHRYGIVASKLAFVQIEKAESRPGVGFGAQGGSQEN
jgi:hypothetical protein